MVVVELSLIDVPPSGGSLEIGNASRLVLGGCTPITSSSPFGGIPRNWKPVVVLAIEVLNDQVPPSGGSLEIGNIR